jgi:hypothetical protein
MIDMQQADAKNKREQDQRCSQHQQRCARVPMRRLPLMPDRHTKQCLTTDPFVAREKRGEASNEVSGKHGRYLATGWGFLEKLTASVAVLERVQPEGWLCGTLHMEKVQGAWEGSRACGRLLPRL